MLRGFGSRLLVCYACCGGFLICFGCGPLLIVRYVSCRLVGFRLGGCRLSGLRLGVFRLSGFGFPGGFRLGNFSMLFDSVRRLRIAGIPGIRSGLNVFG